MTDNKTTPEQFVEEWLSNHLRRWGHFYMEATMLGMPIGMTLKKLMRKYTNLHFPEALEAFARHVWDQACREQREMCAQAYTDYNGEDFDHETVSEAICSATAPEFKLTEKE